MSSVSEILESVLKEITPTNRELTVINEIVERLKFLLEKKAKELKIEYTKIEPQGSTGIKQTQLKNDFDIDLFIGLNYDLYKPKYEGLSKSKLRKASKKDFLNLCNEWILKALDLKEFKNPRLLYAEHPYVTVNYFIQNIKIEINIVLYFDLDLDFIKKNGPITAVDRSPWHGNFVKDNLTNDQKNDVRLLKQFFKSCYSYGDKSPVGKVGFIGYSAELLIYYFGTIQKLFENFNKLKENPLDYFNRSKKELDKIIHFQNDYLIIIDPIDKNRNVASAISEKAYKYCNQRVKTFLNNPNTYFFKINPIPEADLSNSEDPILSKTYILEFNSENNGVHYTIYRDKLYSLGDSIKVNGEKEFSHASRFENIAFEVYFEDVKKEYNLALFCSKPIISKSFIRRGPPVKEKFHAVQFKEKNPNFFEKKGYLWVETERKFNNFFEFIKDFVRKKIPEYLNIVNISISFDVKTTSGKRAIYILKEMVLPFYNI
ncbi:MAG: hypothetical protein ACFE8A_02290 [Candidatus Hodarchaeota archaeon]